MLARLVLRVQPQLFLVRPALLVLRVMLALQGRLVQQAIRDRQVLLVQQV